MMTALFDKSGSWNYLAALERLAFVYAVSKRGSDISIVCLTLAFVGARISEVAALAFAHLNVANEAVTFERLEQ